MHVAQENLGGEDMFAGRTGLGQQGIDLGEGLAGLFGDVSADIVRHLHRFGEGAIAPSPPTEFSAVCKRRGFCGRTLCGPNKRVPLSRCQVMSGH